MKLADIDFSPYKKAVNVYVTEDGCRCFLGIIAHELGLKVTRNFCYTEENKLVFAHKILEYLEEFSDLHVDARNRIAGEIQWLNDNTDLSFDEIRNKVLKMANGLRRNHAAPSAA